MEYLIAVSVLVLIVSLIELLGVRKENEALYIKANQVILINEDIKEEYRLIKKSDSANQGWNTRYRKTIEELEDNLIHQKEMDKKVDLAIKKHQEQAKTIKSLSCVVDESHIVVEAIANNTNKKERLELANKYKFNEK